MTGTAVAKIDHQSRAHSKVVGGSTAKRVMNCTASVLHNQKFPNTESDFASEGTSLHEGVDFILQGMVDEDEQVIGLVFNKQEITPKLYRDAVQPAIAYFDAIQYGQPDDWDVRRYGEVGEAVGPIDFFNEQRVKIPDIPVPVFDEFGNVTGMDEDATFGTCDIIGYAPEVDRTIVLDWKFGVGVPVDAEFNEQMLYYALGAMHTKPTSQFFRKGRPVELFIAQPRSMEGAPFSRWITSVEQIEAFGTDLRRAVATAFTDEAEFKMGSWCKFCPGEATCPAKRGAAANVLELTPQQIADDLDTWLDKADQIIAAGKAIKDAAHKAAELGATFTNYKLVKKRADREFIDEDLTARELIKAGLKKADLYTDPKFKSPAQMEEALKAIGVKELPKTGPKKDQPLFKQESTGTTLAPMKDNRPAVIATKAGLSKLAERLGSK